MRGSVRDYASHQITLRAASGDSTSYRLNTSDMVYINYHYERQPITAFRNSIKRHVEI